MKIELGGPQLCTLGFSAKQLEMYKESKTLIGFWAKYRTTLRVKSTITEDKRAIL